MPCPRHSPSHSPQAGAVEPARDGTTVTLITGDVVTLSAGGASVDPAPGRERVPVTTFREDGHLYVVPAGSSRPARPAPVRRHRTGPARLPRRRDHPRDHERPSSGPAQGHPLPTTGKLWLDGVRTLSLDRTVPQIGAPTAWQAGLTGEGVTVAVIDTGVDQMHPDLAGQEVAERNFSESPDSVDRIGHGTHVASTIAGTGTPYRGVAPGVRLLDAKVFDDDTRLASDSAIIAALHWAADQGAKVVNLSLGDEDRPGTDPVEAAVEDAPARLGLRHPVHRRLHRNSPRNLNSTNNLRYRLT